jgi:hypothetical protein
MNYFLCGIKKYFNIFIRYKDGALLTANNNVKMTSSENKHTLRISDVQNSDEGEYKCKLSKLSGTVTCGAILTITSGNFFSHLYEGGLISFASTDLFLVTFDISG